MAVPFGSDPWLDARLRNVPLPAEMLARLNEISRDDSDADTSQGPQLFVPNAPIPAGPTLSNAQIDEMLAEVVVPTGFVERLQRISLEPRRRVGLRTLALAASLLVAVGLAYRWRSMGPDSPIEHGPLDNQLAEIESSSTVDQPENVTGEATDPTIDLETANTDDRLAEDLRWRLMKEADWPIGTPDNFAEPPALAESPSPRPNKRTLFAADRVSDLLPELETVIVSRNGHGVAPPIVPGYDVRFRARYGQNPFVAPAAHKDLQSLSVPLVTSSQSYQKAWRSLAERKLPVADDVRLEEFLAAVDYEFAPAAAGTLALRTAAGPSPFAEPGTRLLQVGVQAGALLPQTRPGTAITLVVDTSASMRKGGRLAMIRRAVVDLAGQLEANDRLSLIAVSDEASMLIEAAGPDKLARIVAAVQSLQPEQATNVGAGLELAYATALEQTAVPAERRRVVLLTDGLADCGPETAKRIESMVAETAAKGVTLDIMNVDNTPPNAELELLTQLAKTGKGQLFVPHAADDLRFALAEVLTGRKQVVAHDAALKITFNPQVVAAYRLLGHETITLTGTAAANVAVDLRAGEAATALVELRLLPQGGDDVATAELTWRDAATGAVHTATQRISRVQFAKSFAQSPLSLQAAALVGHTAEVLRGSYFVAAARSLSPVLELAAEASPLVTDRPSMQAFLSFVEQADKLRSRGARPAGM
jgi:Ca-activated chloride channel family protein